MKKLTGPEIISILNEIFELCGDHNVSELSYSQNFSADNIDFEDSENEEEGRKLFEPLGKATKVFTEESSNSEAYFVVYFEYHDVYIKVQGAYDSYQSQSDYEDYSFHVVTPQEKTITVYEK